MKIRNGFVSNSSSSSFVMVVKKEDIDKEYSNFSDLHKKMFDKMFTKVDIFGDPAYVYGEVHDRSGEGNVYFNLREFFDEVRFEKFQEDGDEVSLFSNDDEMYDLLEEFKATINKLPSTWSHRVLG